MATAPVTPNPCDANIFSQLFSGNAIVCSTTFQNYETTSGEAQIQQVADNEQAQADVGQVPQANADIAQTAADQQEAQVSGDVQNVTQAIGNSTVDQFFTTCPSGSSGIAIPGTGLPCIPWKYLGIGVALLLVTYVVAVFSSVLPHPR